MPGTNPNDLKRHSTGSGSLLLPLLSGAIMGLLLVGIAVVSIHGCNSPASPDTTFEEQLPVTPRPTPPSTKPRPEEQADRGNDTASGGTGSSGGQQGDSGKSPHDNQSGKGQDGTSGTDGADGATGGRGSDTQRPPVNPREGNRPNGRETPPPGTAQPPAGPGSSSPNGSSSGPPASQRPKEPGGASADDPDVQVHPSTEPEAEESNAGKVLFEGGWIEAAAKQKLQEAYAQRAHAEIVKFILAKLGDAAAPSDYRSGDTKVTPSAEANTFIVSVTYFDPATKERKKCFATIRRSDDSRWSVKGKPL